MPSEVSPSPAMSQRIFGASDMAERIRAFAWETTSLGPISTWNYTLLASVNMMLGMQFPTMMLWGAGDGVPLQRCLRPFDHQSPPWRTRQRLRLFNILQQAPVFFALLEGPEIRQVLNNLAVNAIDAMPTGGRLLLRSRDIATGIVLTVADTSGGIAPENLRRIFEPFTRPKASVAQVSAYGSATTSSCAIAASCEYAAAKLPATAAPSSRSTCQSMQAQTPDVHPRC